MPLRKLFAAVLVVALAGGIYFATQQKNGMAKDETANDPIIATVNLIEIRKSEIIPYLQELVQPSQLQQWKTLDAVPEKVYKTALLNIAQDKLVRDTADKAAVSERPEIKAMLSKADNRIIKNVFLNQLAPGLVSEESIKKRYDELVASIKGKKEFRARHILLANKKEARTIQKALKKRPFDELAKLFSLDEKTGYRGGDIGYVLPGILNPEFEKQVFKLKKGRVSRPFKTSLGWHIARLEDIRPAKAMPYEQAKVILRRQLEQQAIKEYLTRLVANAKIENFIQLKQQRSE